MENDAVQYDAENWLSIQPDDNNNKLVKTMPCNFAVSMKMIFVDYQNSIIPGQKIIAFIYNFQPL